MSRVSQGHTYPSYPVPRTHGGTGGPILEWDVGNGAVGPDQSRRDK